MKKILLLLALTFLCSKSYSQDKLYLIFELMKVDNTQENAYQDTEKFWEKIHEQQVQDGNIIGWDLWVLSPGGEDQNYQYLTVTLYKDPVSMFKGGNILSYAKKAYPKMSEENIIKKIRHSGKTRDLSVRVYLEQIASTSGDFKMTVGTIAYFDFMKVDMGNTAAYVKAEKEIFQPMHQKAVDDGAMGSWELVRFMLPLGSSTFASHMTVRMYENIEQVYKPYDNGITFTDAQQKAIQDGLSLREMKLVNMGRLIKMIRKE